MKNNTVLQGLIALLGVFLIGYISLIVIHSVFGNIIGKLDENVKNEYSRYKIGQYILKEIGSIESKYYKMGIATKLKALKPIQDEIKDEIEDIKKAIDILQNGGTLNNYIKLNISGINETVEKIEFTPNNDSAYTFESIDLLPKLKELEEKVDEMESIVALKLKIHNTASKEELSDAMFRVQLFFKELPTLFVRMQENASRLLYDSKKNLDSLENNIEKEIERYKNLEYVVTYFVMAFIIVIGYLVVKQILNKSKELEEITKEARESEQEAQKANAIKSQFLANMSHEIRTPLNAIIGFSEILSNSKLALKDKEKATIIAKSANALLNIINDILDISKIESGKYEITSKAFNLKDMLEQVVQLYSVNTAEKNIRFLYTLDEDIPTIVKSDETKIKQVLSNIISNAIKFTPENKKVYFNVKLKEIKANYARILFQIKDEGIGISIKDQSKVFKPFSQADSSISKKFGGTGLGLSISQNIINALGSNIELISREEKGSLFYFELKLELDDEKNIEKKPFKYNFAICNILEDEENLRAHLVATIKELGNVYQDDKQIDNIKSIDMIFCFGDMEFAQKLKDRKARFNAPVVFVGNQKKLDNNEQMKALIDYSIDVPVYSSKIQNILNHIERNKKNLQIDTKVEKNKFDGKVLVAEDNANNQLLIKLLLEDLGLDVKIVENGKLAVESYKNDSYDIVLLDINMPIMNGLEALELIKEEQEQSNKHIPIIALTANAIKEDREKYLDSGMDDYLSKPIETNRLNEVLNKYLNKG